jgi:carbamoyltransferase
MATWPAAVSARRPRRERMIILGVNAFHADSSACLLRDGVLVAAAEEERFRRIKHWAGFPSQAIGYCLAEAGVALAEVDHVAVNQDSQANRLKKVGYVLKARPDLSLVLGRVRTRRARASIPELLAKAFPGSPARAEFHAVEHHLAHLASAFDVSPFEEAVAVSVDGFGDFASTAWGVGRGDALAVEGRIFFPHSLGLFYQALTQHLGFPHYGDEYKVMGLAPYGQPRQLAAMRQIVRLLPGGGFELDLDYFRHHRERTPDQWAEGAPEFGDLFSGALEELLGPRRDPAAPLEARHHDLAASVQAMYEEAFFHLIEPLQARSGLTDLVLAGGCAANSVANGKVRRRTAFRRVYVQPAAGDAGGALGAALSVWRRLGGRRAFTMDHAFWGPGYSDGTLGALLASKAGELAAAGCRARRADSDAALCAETAAAIADGQVVGWFQGRMEWGPRALGARSIVCDPRRADMKSILNAKIKRRESFRPFAPSVLDHAVADWFEEDDDVPFMTQVFQIRPDKRALVPAVTHVDGSGRLQTVHRAANPRYYGLIEAFEALTGTPMVLNTSFNENEPVVCRPQEALDCFLRTRMDLLVLGDWLVERVAADAPAERAPPSAADAIRA